ncbi:MAG: acetate/propionate family kinase [Candidatus Woesearchaeota archaeon]
MKYLILNAGSSSLKFALFEDETEIIRGKVERLFFDPVLLISSLAIEEKKEVKTYGECVKIVLDELLNRKIISSLEEINYVGHRVVHGKNISTTIEINKELLETLKETIQLAPLHNPPAIETILGSMEFLKVKHFAVFDTAFHQSMPNRFFKYPIPLYEYRRYGFHGISHKYVYNECKRILNKDRLTAVTLHLGNGCSMALIKDGKVIHTTMGYTPLEGLIMGTRCGNIDPGIVLDIARKKGIDECDKILNKNSGFIALTGFSDIREIRNLANLNNAEDLIKLYKQYEFSNSPEDSARLALVMFSDRIIQYLSWYKTLEDIEAIIFTGGIGENFWQIRKLVCLGLKIEIDDQKNIENEEILGENPFVCVIKTNEELQIVREIKEKIIN